ncbi:MAG: succinylglutamate-semialdehyde dehydrogenase [Sphingobium sp.]
MSEELRSIDPASGELVWSGAIASAAQCEAAVARARIAFADWSNSLLEERIATVRQFGEILDARLEMIAQTISRETGKLLWESRAEVRTMIGKVAVSIAAQDERAGQSMTAMPFGQAVLRHRPLGVMAVLGPYNFPGHLPNGHIVPALLAGNCVVFKPSEEAPMTGELMTTAWADAGLPEAVFQVVQGDSSTGKALVAADIDGLLFTGSAQAGAQLRHALADRPHVILALELGGNNPLVAWDGDPEAAASIIVQSAFITTGQRCSCTRRLILPAGAAGDAILKATLALTDSIRIAAWNEPESAYIGPLVSARAARNAHRGAARLVESGARSLRPFTHIVGRSEAFVTPAVMDVTRVTVPDAEIFAPLLQVIRVADFEAAICAANDTKFGLTAGLISEDDTHWAQFLSRVRAGIVNRNRPTTGASSTMPFGGVGQSGNHRPSAYYAADYCAYPVASFEAKQAMDKALPQ